MFRFASMVLCAAGLTAAALVAAATARFAQAAQPAADPFDGRSLAGWTTLDGKPVADGWELVDGVIHRKPGGKAGHIVTVDEFGDFSLSFEFKIAPGGNSGLKYRVRSYGGKVLGCEYQIYDDQGARKQVAGKNSCGSLYDLYEPNDQKQLRTAGQYNQARIVVEGDRIEHWLNGKKIVSATVGDAQWERRVAASKFADVADFARNPRGRIMLTDHGSEVWYRNFRFEPAGAARTAGGSEPLSKQTHVYKRVGDLEIKADVLHGAGSAPRPVVVWIHGGGLINGHRESVPRWIGQAFLPRGYAIVSIDYRLAPESKLPVIVEDVEDALHWVYQRGPELFGADPQRVAVAGGSAGGYLTLVSGFRARPRPSALVSLWGYGDLGAEWTYEASGQPRHNRAALTPEEAARLAEAPAVSDSRLRAGDGGGLYQYCRRSGAWAAMVGGWDPLRKQEKFVPFMPERNVTAEYPPTLLIHGDADTDVPYASSVRMAAQLKKYGVEHELIRVVGAEHGLVGAPQPAVDDAYRAAAEFVARHLEKR